MPDYFPSLEQQEALGNMDCTCEQLTSFDSGPNTDGPPQFEQDPFCPQHPDPKICLLAYWNFQAEAESLQEQLETARFVLRSKPAGRLDELEETLTCLGFPVDIPLVELVQALQVNAAAVACVPIALDLAVCEQKLAAWTELAEALNAYCAHARTGAMPGKVIDRVTRAREALRFLGEK